MTMMIIIINPLIIELERAPLARVSATFCVFWRLVLGVPFPTAGLLLLLEVSFVLVLYTLLTGNAIICLVLPGRNAPCAMLVRIC